MSRRPDRWAAFALVGLAATLAGCDATTNSLALAVEQIAGDLAVIRVAPAG